MVAGLIVIVPIALFLVDLASLAIGVTSGDTICREAARAASIGDPNQCTNRAQRVIDQANATKGGFIKQFSLVAAAPNGLVYPTNLGATGGQVQGSIAVDTSVAVAPPFILRNFAQTNLFTFKSHQSFPITYTLPQSVSPN